MAEKASRTDWKKIIERWKKSRLSQNRFCLKEGISLSTMRYHLKREKQETRFIELSGPLHLASITQPIEIFLPETGWTIRIPVGFCEETFRKVMKVLGGKNHVR